MNIKQAIQAVSDKEPLFSSLMYALKPVESTQHPTLGTDGEYLYYNPDFLSKLTDEEASAVVLHETLHCAYEHIWRRENRDMYKWNVATDYAINIMVNEVFRLPPGTLLDMKYFGMSAEEIYNTLPKDKKEQSWCDKNEWKNDQGQTQKEEKEQEGQGQKPKDGQGKDGKSGKGGVMDKLAKAFGGKPKEKPLPKSTMSDSEKQAKWEKLFKKTFIDHYGEMPDSIKRSIEKAFYMPVLDWASLVSSLLSEDVTDYTFSQPDRRFLEADFVLPDLYSYDRLKDVVFAYDTSGSITDEDLNAFYMETLNLFNNFSSLQGWIAVCDAAIHHFSEVNPQQSFTDFNFQGGGGTDFRPVFNKIKDKGMKPKALFYFTDTEGSFPREAPEYPVFWLVKSEIGDNSRLHVPFGTVIRFLPRT